MLSERRGRLEECDICSRFGARKSLLLTAATPLPKYDYTLLSDLNREPKSINPKSKFKVNHKSTAKSQNRSSFLGRK